MTDKQDGGPAFPDARDELAIQVMLKRLEQDPLLFREPKHLASRSYAIVDALLAARAGGDA